MAEKPEFVDVISEATRQHRRRAMPIDVDPMPASAGTKDRSRMAHSTARQERWRLETLTPWKIKLKPWEFVDWD
jgi:hypothetical protein